jgi:hypothetical protein
MPVRYEILNLNCAHCGKRNEHIRYAPPAGRFFTCRFCTKVNVIRLQFVAIKPEDDGD